METLKIMDSALNLHDTGVDLEEVEALFVVVLTGSEIVTAIKADGTRETFDSVDSRPHTLFDGEYGVHKSEFAEWAERESPYDWFGRMMRNATV